MWVTGVDRGKPGYVVVVATKDSEKAQEAIDKGVKSDGGKVKERSYEGVDYQVDEDGVAAGIVADFFTVGTEAEFKRTVKAKKGDSLAENKRFQKTIDGLDDERIGLFYVDLKPFFEQALKSDPDTAGQLEQFRAIFPIDKLEPLAGSLQANGDRIAFDTLMSGPGVGALKAFAPFLGTGKTPLVSELPGDSWAAFGAPNVGPGLKSIFDRVAGAFGGAAAAQQLQQQYGLNLDRDVFGWIGDIAIFVRGSDKASLEGGLVIKATNPANMRGAFGKLVGLIQSQGGQKVTPCQGQGRGHRVLTRGGQRPRQAGHPRPLGGPHGPRRRRGRDGGRARAGREARRLRAVQAGQGRARRRLRAVVRDLDAGPRQGGRRLRRERPRLGQGQALPRGVHRDRERRDVRGRPGALARGGRAEVARHRAGVMCPFDH